MEKNTRTASVKKGLKRLIELGRERGFVTYEDISKIAGPKAEAKPEDLKHAVTVLSENEIEIVDGFAGDQDGGSNSGRSSTNSSDNGDSSSSMFGEDDADWGVDEPDVPTVKKAREEEPTAPAVAKVKPPERDYGSDSTDPVRMYLQEMGSVPLLSREEEVTIAKEIESGLHEIRDCVYSIPLSFRYVIGLGERLKAGEIEPRDVFAEDSEEDKSSAERDEKRVKAFVKDVTALKRTVRTYETNMPKRFAPKADAKAKRKPTPKETKFEAAQVKVCEQLIAMKLGDRHVNGIVAKLKEAQSLARRHRRVIIR